MTSASNTPAYTAFLESDIRIKTVSFTAVKPFPLKKPFQDAAMELYKSFEFAILRVEDEDGFCSEVPISSSSLPMLEHHFLPRLFKPKRARYDLLYEDLYWSIRNEGFRSPHAAAPLGSLDIALHDLAAQKAGLPFHRFLGAKRDWSRVYVCGGGTHLSIPDLLAEAQAFHSQGFDTLKMKIGLHRGHAVDEDVRRVTALVAGLEGALSLAADANQVYSFENASTFLRETQDLNLAWVEEPVHSADLGLFGKLAQHARTEFGQAYPFALGESELSAHVFPSLVEAGCRHLQPIPGWLPGVREWMTVKDLAVVGGHQLSSGSFSHISCEFIACAPEEAHTELLQAIIAEMDRFYVKAPRLEGGKYYLDSQPGLTIAFHHELLKKENLIDYVRIFNAQDFDGFSARVI